MIDAGSHGGVQVIAVDWSGAMSPAVQRHTIWLAIAENGRLLALEAGRTREATVDRILHLVDEHPQTMVALDFAFGFPAWFGRSLGCGTGIEVWDIAARSGESWLAEVVPPFWGRPGCRRPLPDPERTPWRRTEIQIPAVAGIRPKSVFQIGGAGAVGTGSIRGMPALRRLCAAGVAIWPFQAVSWPFAVEAWPRLCTGPVVKSRACDRFALIAQLSPKFPAGLAQWAGASEDAFDAAFTAVALSDANRGERSIPGPATVTTDDLDRLEGQVWTPDAGWTSKMQGMTGTMMDTDPSPDPDPHVETMQERLDAVEEDIAKARQDEEKLHPERSEQTFADSGTVNRGMDDQTIAPG